MTQPNGRGRNRGADGRRRWDGPDVVKDIIRRYVDDQQSIRQTAAAVGCSYGTVHMILTSAGVQLRPRGGAARRRPGPPSRSAEPAVATGVAVRGTTPSGRAGSRS